MVEKSVKSIIKSYLLKLKESGINVSRGIVFGSQAKGTAGVWSDIDIMVISPMFDGMKDRSDINTPWRLAARTDSRIEPIACGEKQWFDDDSSDIIEYARREGEEVAI